MRTYLLFTMDHIGDFQLKQFLPKDYYNLVDLYLHIESEDPKRNHQ